MEDSLEPYRLAVTKIELAIEKFIKEQRKLMFSEPIRARRRIDDMRAQYLLNKDTIGMFGHVGMMSEYTTLLNKFNKVLDGDLT